MKKSIQLFRNKIHHLILSLFFILLGEFANAQTPVSVYGQLRVNGNRIVDQNGNAVQLRGMSLFWSQWVGQYYNYDAIKWLRDDWKCTIVRAAMAVDQGGYATNPTTEKNKVMAVVDAAISLGIYVIIDFHCHYSNNYVNEAKTFFGEMAQKYGSYPNVIYELWNEPTDQSWAGVIKPYHETVIDVIRQYDPDNIIVCGTRQWSQLVNEAASNTINKSNIAYTLHFYANSHGQWLRDEAQAALNKGVALFVTEYGTCDASGDGPINETETRAWWNFLDNNKISHCAWTVANISGTSSVLVPEASPYGGWPISQIKPSGILVRNELISKYSLTCEKTAITPYLRVNDGGWQQTNEVTVNYGDKVQLGPWPVSGGSWSWSDDGTSGASREQIIYPTSNGVAIATYTNSCGTKSSRKFIVTVNIISGAKYKITAKHSGLVLDVSGISTENGANVYQWNYIGGLNQQWIITDAGGGYFRLSPAHAPGKGLDIGGYSFDNGANAQIWDYWGGDNQKWQLNDLKNGYYELKVKHSGQCLDIYNASMENAGNAVQWTSNGSNNQQFKLEMIPLLKSSPISGVTTTLENENPIVFPNPSLNGNISVKLPENFTNCTITVYNSQGQIVNKIITNEPTINFEKKLVSGIYLISIKNANKQYCQKILVK